MRFIELGLLNSIGFLKKENEISLKEYTLLPFYVSFFFWLGMCILLLQIV